MENCWEDTFYIFGRVVTVTTLKTHKTYFPTEQEHSRCQLPNPHCSEAALTTLHPLTRLDTNQIRQRAEFI